MAIYEDLGHRQGVRTAVDTDLQDIVFDQISGDAMQFDAGNNAARRISIAPMTAVGARVADGASFDLADSDVVIAAITSFGYWIYSSPTLGDLDGDGELDGGTDQVPLVKASNCILAMSDLPATGPELPCIRCGKCVDACPARLLPQQLYWYASSKNIDRLIEHNLFDCIECGCCIAGCGTVQMREDFVGAVGLNKMARFRLDPRDTRDDADFYEVIGDDDATYIIRQDTLSQDWELTYFRVTEIDPENWPQATDF